MELPIVDYKNLSDEDLRELALIDPEAAWECLRREEEKIREEEEEPKFVSFTGEGACSHHGYE